MSNDERALVGYIEIAEFINKPVTTTSYLLMRHELPAYKIGRLWHMLPSRYRRWQEEQANATLATGVAQRKPPRQRKQPPQHILRQKRRPPTRDYTRLA